MNSPPCGELAMASDLISASDLRTALNGLPYVNTSGADAAALEARIDEADAYMRQGWGPHPTVAANPDEFAIRRRALIDLIRNYYEGKTEARDRARAMAFVGYNEPAGE